MLHKTAPIGGFVNVKNAASPLTISAVVVVGPHRFRGVLNELEHRGCIVDLVDDITIEVPLDTPVYIELPSIDGARITGRLRRRVGSRVTVDVTRNSNERQRYFPRVTGGMSVEYRLVPNSMTDALGRSWLRGLSVANNGEWYAPSGEVEFSASGLRCEDGVGCAVGDLLLLALNPENKSRPIRATARVVRTLIDTSRTIAVEFVDIRTQDLEVLAQHTYDRQLATLDD